ncbi:MAG: glycosyltransferase family 9 protein [Acidobacteriota bacterium]
MKDIRKILIVRLSSLGDIIHTLPAFQSLRATFPKARIDWLVERRLAFLLSAAESIDEVLPIDTHSLRANFARRDSWLRLWEPLQAVRARRYDLAIDFQGLLKTAFLSLASGARTRIGFSKALVRERPADWFYHCRVNGPAVPVHVARLNLLLAQAAGAGSGELRAHLKAGSEAIHAMESQLHHVQVGEYVVINPGGGWSTKRWHPARYAALTARIQKELELGVIVVTGPGEEGIFKDIANKCAEHPPFHFQVPFLQLIPLLSRARLIISGDTGPLHLACALGTPAVAIMGPTSPVRNGPWSENDEAVFHHLPCSFCNGRSCPTKNECMDISVAEVFAAIARRLERGQ